MPGRPRSTESHAAILTAAIALVRDVGYDAVTMEGIAARAGVGKTTVYRWWPSKELLVAEAIGRIVRMIRVPDTGSVREDVLTLLRATTTMYSDPATGLLLSGFVAAMARSDRVGDAVRSALVAPLRAAVRTALERGVARGELREDVRLDIVLDLLSGPSFYRYLLLGKPVHARYVRGVVDTVLRGIARPT